MKRIYLSIVVIMALATSSILQAAVIPYLPPMQNFGGSAVDLATYLPSIGNYTLEVQGTVGVEISIAGGVLTYTPTTNGVVRFSQKNGKVYVYEGNMFMTTLTPVWSTTYPVIADATAHTDANNLLQNAGFETPGSLVGGTNYNFGTPWQTNVTVSASGGIRTSEATTGNVNGTWECVWRGSGNTNYFAQQLAATIKPNTSYKIIVNQIAGGNAYATFYVGLGSTVNGLEYGFMPIVLGNTKNGTWSVNFRTPATITTPVYFTFKNTPSNTANSGSDPVAQFDYLALVAGIDVPGITGVSSAILLNGSAYAPENVSIDFGAGDAYDMTTLIANQSFEDVQADKQQTIPGWTKTGPANSEYCTRNDQGPLSGAFKHLNVYFQYWSSSRPDFSISQIVTGIPNGKYRLTAAAGGGDGATGTFVYAADKQTEVTSSGADYSVDAIAVDGTLTIGFKSVSRNLSWAYADNFRLYYFGEVQEPVLSLSTANLFFDPNNLTKTFTVTGANLTANAILTAPTGIGLDKNELTPAEVAAGTTVTATFDNATQITNGLISVASGTLTKEITVNASADLACFTPLYNDKTNLVLDPFCNDRSKFGGWGNVEVSNATVLCGLRSMRVFGGSLDVSVAGGAAIQSNKTYRVKANIFVPAGHTAKFGTFLIGNSGDQDVYTSTTNDAWEVVDFTFNTKTVTTGGVFFQRVSGSDGVYIDNYEMYDVTDIVAGVKNTSSNEMKVFVQNNSIIVDANTIAAGNAEIGIYNLQGARIHTENTYCNAGYNRFKVNRELPSGVYFVKLNIDGEVTTTKLVK